MAYLSSEVRLRLRLMSRITLMTMSTLKEIAMMTGTAKNQMLSPVSIQQLKKDSRLISINFYFD